MPASSSPFARQIDAVFSQPQRLWWRAGAAVWLTGRIIDGRIRVRFTAPLRQLLGLERAPRGGELVTASVAAPDHARLQRALTALIDHDEPVALRYALHAGGEAPPKTLWLGLERQHGHPDRVVGVLRDIGAEALIPVQALALLARVHAVDRSSLLAEMGAHWAHELNQPLAAVTTFAQAGERLIAQPNVSAEKVQRVCRELSQQALRAGEVMQRMRGLISPPTEHREHHDAGDLLRDFMQFAQPLAALRRVVMTLDVQGHARVNVDAAALHHVLWVLLDNALDAVQRQDSPRIGLRLRVEAEGAAITMLDSGPGLSDAAAAHLPRVSFSSKPQGMGLGLAASQKWLERQGSTLRFGSDAVGGSIVTFVLPISAS